MLDIYIYTCPCSYLSITVHISPVIKYMPTNFITKLIFF